MSFQTDGVDRAVGVDGRSKEWEGSAQLNTSGRLGEFRAIGVELEDGSIVIVIDPHGAIQEIDPFEDESWVAVLLRLQELSAKIDSENSLPEVTSIEQM